MTLRDENPSATDSKRVFGRQERGRWVRLRTLIFLRWVAILGQIIALTVAQQAFGLQLEIGLCYLAVGLAVIGNLFAISIFPENKRLSEGQNFLMVFFDLLQLGFLLLLTGGLNNPFSILLLGPVTVSAAVLTLRSFLIMGMTAIGITSLLTQIHLPLQTTQGVILSVPNIFLFGYWIALVIAVFFIGAYARRVSLEIHSMSEALSATQLVLEREQKLTDLGGVVAAAAHELGTPLATIKLTSAELIDELSDRPDLKDDATLIKEQADRCRDILRSMGRAGKDDLHLKQAPLSAILEEAAEPHEGRGVNIAYSVESNRLQDPAQPIVVRKPEVIHGLRNLVQNAVDFAREDIWIDAEWSEDVISIRISDDGPGYPSHVIGRIGDPFMRSSKKASGPDWNARPEYEGMGLGLFIAKTLLERTGAELTFANGNDGENGGLQRAVGAIVQVAWPRRLIEADSTVSRKGLGSNQVLNA